MTQAVQHDLRDGAFADRVVPRLVQRAGREAVGRACEVVCGTGEAERPCSGVRIGRERHRGVERSRILGREVDEPDRLDRGQLCLGHDALLRHRGACRVG